MPMAGRVRLPGYSPVVFACNEKVVASTENGTDRGVVVFILKFVRGGICRTTGSNLNVIRTIRLHFRCDTDRGSVCQFTHNFNDLSVRQIDIVCFATLFDPGDVDITGNIEFFAFTVKIYTAAVNCRGVVCDVAARNSE